MPIKTITLKDPPQAQGRPRFSVRGSHGFAWDPHKDKKNWARLQVASQWKNDKIKTEIQLEIVFYMPIPKSTSKKKRNLMIENVIKHIKKPDIDNLAKFAIDALTDIVFEDDKLIWQCLIEKRYGEKPRTEIVLRWD